MWADTDKARAYVTELCGGYESLRHTADQIIAFNLTEAQYRQGIEAFHKFWPTHWAASTHSPMRGQHHTVTNLDPGREISLITTWAYRGGADYNKRRVDHSVPRTYFIQLEDTHA